MSQVRAKFKVRAHESTINYDGKPVSTVKMGAVSSGSEENKSFFASTPFGEISLGTVNEKVAKSLPLGAEVYVDFSIAKDPEPAV